MDVFDLMTQLKPGDAYLYGGQKYTFDEHQSQWMSTDEEKKS